MTFNNFYFTDYNDYDWLYFEWCVILDVGENSGF